MLRNPSLIRRMVPVALLAVGVVLAGCSSSTPGASGTTTTTSGSSGSSGSLGSLSSALKNAETASFKATYTANENGTSSTIVIEQAPPKSLFSSGAGSELVNTGTASYICSNSGGSETCISEGSTGSNPLAGLTALFSPATYITALQGFESEVAAKVAGVSVSTSSATFAGQDATCVTVSHAGQNEKYCVTHSGILADVTTSSGSFELTSYSSSPPSSDFSLPAGATVETIPAGITVPSY